MTESRRDFIAKVFHNEKTDRVPVGFWHHFLGDETGSDAFAHPELTDTVLAGQADFYKAFRPDLIKIMTDGYFSYPLEALKKPLTSPKELKNIRPLGKDSDWYRFQIAYAKKLTALYGKEVPLFYNLFAVPRTIEFMQASLGYPVDIASWIQEYPEETAHVFDVISKDYADLARGLIEEGGVDGIYLSVNNVSYDRLTEDAYKKYVAPYEIRILEAANAAKGSNILHICGYHGFHNHLEWYKDYPFQAVNWAVKVEGVPLKEGKELFHGKAVIGGFGQTEKDVIYRGSREEIEEETKKILDEVGTTGVILGADCTIPRDTDVNHLAWVREAADRYGK